MGPAGMPPTSFGDLLQRHRRAAGLTQEELAERARLSVRGISNLERGVRRFPQRGTMLLLTEALGLQGAERDTFAAAARGQAAERPIIATNVPLALTSFVGREREVQTIRTYLEQTRLLTLTGAGGCGKTRLALEVARALAQDARVHAAWADGIWLVDLAALSDGAHVAQSVAKVLGILDRSGSPLTERLCAFLAERAVLLLLDNCEHLLEACGALVEALLSACPRLVVLATSREALGIGGEQPWRVPSLSLPDPRGRLTLTGSAACDAVQLLLQRAQRVRPTFALAEHDVVLAAQICRRLDGIPLAIELAAARLATLSLEQVATRLDDGFRLLTGGSRTALPRHQTLQGTLDWSYGMLDEAERLLLHRLSVFAGGWTLEAAEAVCAGGDLAHEQIVDLLSGLVAKSLVVVVDGGSETRYRLLETVRHYGSHKLAAGETAVLRDRHLGWHLTLAEQAAQRIGGVERARWLDRLETELENFRTALQWSTTLDEQPEAGLRLAAALEDFWYIRGYMNEGCRWLDHLLARNVAIEPAVRARALEVVALLHLFLGNPQQALPLFETAYTLHTSLGNVRSATWALNYQGLIALNGRQYDRATALLEQVLPIHREQGDLHGVGWALSYLAAISHAHGDYTHAAARYRESLVAFEELSDAFGISYQQANLAAVARDSGELAQAKHWYRASLETQHVLFDKGRLAATLESLAVVATQERQWPHAARLFGAASMLRQTVDYSPPWDVSSHTRALTALRSALEEPHYTTAWQAGEVMTVEEAVAYALQDDG